MRKIRDKLVLRDGRVAPFWEHWAYVVPGCTLAATILYFIGKALGKDVVYLPLLGVGIATLFAFYTYNLDQEANEPFRNEVPQTVPRMATLHWLMSACIAFGAFMLVL